MSYDPAWDMPQPNWVQQGSFETGAIPPAVAPDAGTPVCIGPVAEEWLPYVQGALDQLKNPSSWIVADDTALYTTLQRVDQLRSIIGMATGCCDVAIRLTPGCVLQYSIDGGATWTDVTGWAANFAECVRQATIPSPPLLPPGTPVADRACNIASYLATDVIQAAITQAINAYDHDLSLLALAGNVATLTFAFELPWTSAFIYALYDLYAYFTAGNIADLRTASTDATLWSRVTCAIYNAIKDDGAVTATNCAAVIANICAISYAHPVAVTTICAYVTALGCDQLRALQVVGALAVGNCDACSGTWCKLYDFRIGAYGSLRYPPYDGVYVAGVGWQSQCLRTGANEIGFYLTLPSLHTIHALEAWVIAPLGGGGALRRIYLQHPFDTTVASSNFDDFPHPLPGAAQAFSPIDLAGDVVAILYRSSVCGFPDTIRGLQVYGTGPNPFGPDDCNFP